MCPDLWDFEQSFFFFFFSLELFLSISLSLPQCMKSKKSLPVLSSTKFPVLWGSYCFLTDLWSGLFLSVCLLKFSLTDLGYLQESLDSLSWLVLSEWELSPKLCFHHSLAELTNVCLNQECYAIFRPDNFQKQQSLVRLKREKRADRVQLKDWQSKSPSHCLHFQSVVRCIAPGWFISSARTSWQALGMVQKSPLTK